MNFTDPFGLCPASDAQAAKSLTSISTIIKDPRVGVAIDAIDKVATVSEKLLSLKESELVKAWNNILEEKPSIMLEKHTAALSKEGENFYSKVAQARKIGNASTFAANFSLGLTMADVGVRVLDITVKALDAYDKGESPVKALVSATVANTTDYIAAKVFSTVGSAVGAVVGKKTAGEIGSVIGAAVGGFSGGVTYSSLVSDIVYNTMYDGMMSSWKKSLKLTK